jgi:hypothetical protein
MVDLLKPSDEAGHVASLGLGCLPLSRVQDKRSLSQNALYRKRKKTDKAAHKVLPGLISD